MQRAVRRCLTLVDVSYVSCMRKKHPLLYCCLKCPVCSAQECVVKLLPLKTLQTKPQKQLLQVDIVEGQTFLKCLRSNSLRIKIE